MKSKNFNFNTEDYDSLSISQLKRQADYWFRYYLLKKVKRDGIRKIYCPLTNRYYSEKYIHICHFIDRGKSMPLRYSEDNCILCSSYSNTFEAQELVEGHKSLHHKKFAEYLGEKKVGKLLELSNKLTIFARQDYIDLIKKFRSNE
jgi:hypothetical protein